MPGRARRCMPMTHLLRPLIPDEARLKSAASGPSCETSGRGDRPHRPLVFMPTLRIARENALINCCRSVAAFYMQTPMQVMLRPSICGHAGLHPLSTEYFGPI